MSNAAERSNNFNNNMQSRPLNNNNHFKIIVEFIYLLFLELPFYRIDIFTIGLFGIKRDMHSNNKLVFLEIGFEI